MLELFIDVETTGTDPKRHAITQIAGMIVKDGATVDHFNFRVRPHDGAEIDEAALVVTHLSREEIMAYPTAASVFQSLKAVLLKHIDPFKKNKGADDKAWFIAFNAPFDNQFMREFFSRNGERFFGSWFWVPDICVYRLAGIVLMDVRHKLPDFKLKAVADHLMIDVTGHPLLSDTTSTFHDALYDIVLTEAVYRAYIAQLETRTQYPIESNKRRLLAQPDEHNIL